MHRHKLSRWFLRSSADKVCVRVCAPSNNAVCSSKTYLCITQDSLITVGAGCGPHGSLCAVSHCKVSPPRRTAASTSLSLRPSWYQHTGASGQQLPDTDAVGVPPSLWLSRTAVISHDISVTLRIRAARPLCVWTSWSWLRVLCVAARVSFAAFADNKLFKSVYTQCQWHEEWFWNEKMGGSMTLHNGSWSQLYKCFGSWFCLNSLLFRMSTSGSVGGWYLIKHKQHHFRF